MIIREQDTFASGGRGSPNAISPASNGHTWTQQACLRRPQNTTFYKAASGALVFATGSMGFCNALTDYRYLSISAGVHVAGMQVLMLNIMGALKGPVWRGF